MIEKAKVRIIAAECLSAVRQMSVPWHRRGRPTKPAEGIIKRGMSNAAMQVLPAGLSDICHNLDDYESIYRDVVSAMFGLFLEEGSKPKKRKKPEKSSCSNRQVCGNLGIDRDPVLGLFWKNEDGEEFGPWVPNPDSSEPYFGTNWRSRVPVSTFARSVC